MTQPQPRVPPRPEHDRFPKIDRYFPHCQVAALEAVAKHRFGVQDFSKIYGRHSFHYQRPVGAIGIGDNGVDLNLELHRCAIAEGELQSMVEDLYGLRTVRHAFHDLQRYQAFCEESLDQGAPLVVGFDLRFIKERREYGRVSSPHALVLTGYGRAGFHASEQMLGPIVIERTELERCFEHNLRASSEQEVWQLVRAREGERPLSRAEVRAQVEANLANLQADSTSFGLGALQRFSADIESYLGMAEPENQPFAVPGLWVFSHERHAAQRWLAHVAGLLPPSAAPTVAELSRLLEIGFKRWLSVDYLIEKCLLAGDGSALQALPTHLHAILVDEQATVRQWLRLCRALEAVEES